MADVMELRMNVAALKRVDPYVKEILETATHVALYTYNADANEWEKTDVEGALFVYSRNGEPYNGVLIMNRLNTNNLVEPVMHGLEIQLQQPFLLYRNSRCRIYGIWFYDKDECVRVAALLAKLVKENVNTKSVPLVNSPIKRVGGNVMTMDIFSMLSKAQEDFNSNKIGGKNKVMEVKHNISQGQEIPSQSVVDFFAKASSGASHFATEKSQQSPLFCHPPQTGLLPQASDGNNLKPLLQRLMSNPAHSVEHIEKQQRSITPHGELNTRSKSKQVNDIGKSKIRPVSSGNLEEKFSTLNVSDPNNRKVFPEQPNLKNCTGLEVENSFLRIASPNSSTAFPAPFFPTAMQNIGPVEMVCSDQRPVSAPLCSTAETPQKPALMPPTMFTSSASKEKSDLDFVNSMSKTSLVQTKGEIGSPLLNSCPLVSRENDVAIVPEPLTKNQLLQAVTYLIKNDPEFVNKLHEAYVKSFSEIVH